MTVGYFEDTAEFAQAFRRDLVALVSDYFRRGRSFAESSPTAPGVVAAALVPPERRLRRRAVETELEGRLERDPVALVTGPLGSGKTVFLSDLCDRRNWALVECGEKAPQEVLTNAANAIRGLLNLPAQAYLLPADAQNALRLAWETSTSVTLALDDLRSAETLDRVRSAAAVSNTHRLIVSSREDIPTAGSVYEMPPLDLDETREFAKMNRDAPLVAGELVEIHSASKGNPLYLRYYLAGTPGDFANNLAEYEARVWRSLTVNAQEVLCYLAWAGPAAFARGPHAFGRRRRWVRRRTCRKNRISEQSLGSISRRLRDLSSSCQRDHTKLDEQVEASAALLYPKVEQMVS